MTNKNKIDSDFLIFLTPNTAFRQSLIGGFDYTPKEAPGDTAELTVYLLGGLDEITLEDEEAQAAFMLLQSFSAK